MDRIWTPWRMAYIKGEEGHDGCFLCDFPSDDPQNDRRNLVLVRGALAFIIMNKYPYNSGHLVVAPYRHCARYDDLTLEEHADIAALASRCVRSLQDAYQPEGFNIGVNQGRAAGAGVPDHLHMHVVPRWAGDTNYMTTIGETKVLPEALEDTYDKLRARLDAGGAQNSV
ncbi:MAG TPA: HIT domain-containing protein [Actinomycetota bacterium]|nr:HIT domain-containing protein [Actinomycetota bacterium]